MHGTRGTTDPCTYARAMVNRTKRSRLWFGKSLIKLVVPVRDPGAPPAPGGIQGGTGYRYWTMTIHNLDEVLSAVQAAGQKIVRPRTEVRPGVVIGMVEDPDGNWVEFIQAP